MKILALGHVGLSFSQIRPEYETYIGLSKAGHDVTVVIPPNCPYEDCLKGVGISLLYCYPSKKICRASIQGLRAALRRESYDIVYATNSKTIPNAAFACIGFPVKMVAYRGTTGGLYRHDPTAYLTILHPRVDGVICVSDAVRDDVIQRVWRNHKQVVTIYKGHNLDWYDQQPADLSEFGVGPEHFVLICAVNVRRSKGIDLMLDACNSLAHLQNLHLLLVGKGMGAEPYASLIASNKMKERIHVAGFRTDAPELIAASDVLVQPSRSGEGLPRAVMEAMGYGTPVIITETGGGKEVVHDQESGYVIPVEDPSAIARSVESIYSNPELARSMSAKASSLLRDEYSSQITVDRYAEYFEQLTR